MNTRLRPLIRADLPAVLAIEFEANPSPWRAKDFEGFLVPPDLSILDQAGPLSGAPIGGQHRAWVYADPEIRGFICGVGVADEIELQSIAVEKSRWSMGVGSALLEGLLSWARENGFHKLHLEVREGNLRALQFYQRWGFVTVGRRPNYYPNGGETAILMSLGRSSSG